jgi:hypothetical protein
MHSSSTPHFGQTFPAPPGGRYPLHLCTDDLRFSASAGAHLVELVHRAYNFDIAEALNAILRCKGKGKVMLP